MRILINALAWRQHGGSDRHLRGLLAALAKTSPDIEYVLCVDAGFDVPNVYHNIIFRKVDARSTWRRIWWDQVILPRAAKAKRADAIWAVLGFGSAWPTTPQVIFLRNTLYYCDYHLTTLSGSERYVIILRRWLQWLSLRTSHHIITPTTAMRDMVRGKHPDIPAECFTVIPHAFDIEELAGAVALPAIAQKALAECSQSTLKILYVGHILPYKQLDVLLEAFQRVSDATSRPVKLLLTIASEDWPSGYEAFVQQVKTRGLEEPVKVLGKIPQLAIGHLYQACDVVAFPSLCESFGWPLVEATSLGIPVLAADTPVNREMAGEGALYFAPRDVTSVAEQLQKLLEDEQLRAMVGAAGRAHFERTHLTWPEYVQRCLEATFGSKARDNRDSP
jgi:glycosyltransferase involved in cell wall biosynthesis